MMEACIAALITDRWWDSQNSSELTNGGYRMYGLYTQENAIQP